MKQQNERNNFRSKIHETISNEKKHEPLSFKELLQQEDAPSFLELPTSDDEVEDLEGRYNVDTTISANPAANTKRINEYFFSSVRIRNSVTFTSNYAFGAGYAAGSGGAIFVSYSCLLIDSGTVSFTSNQASVGGAICSLATGIYFVACPTFTSNVAFRYGGAIYFRGVFD